VSHQYGVYFVKFFCW